MVKSIKNSVFTVIFIFILIGSCAKMSSPTGGPRDKEAPVVVKCTPANGEKNFKDKKITITFNEFVTLDKINEKLMVSPPMTKKPKVSLKGKSVVVEYDDELKDSTTYTFYFQDAIRDLNEGNIIDNYQFVFSTGPVIDSLSVTGNVYSALSLNPPENALVMLYRNLADSAVMKQIPDYISKAGKNGYFRFDNVKEGIYRLYALVDADNSKNFNLPDEEFAFMDTPVEISAEKNFLPVIKDTVKITPGKTKTADTIIKKGEYRLILFQPAKKMHYLNPPSRSAAYKLSYSLSMPPDTIGFDFAIPGTDEKSYRIEKSSEKDTILVWLTDSALYSQPQISTLIGYPYTDSTGKIYQKKDTIQMRFLVPKTTRTRIKKVPFKVTSNLMGGLLKPGQQIIFKSQTPFRIPDTSKIRLYETEGEKRKMMTYFLTQDSTNSCRIKFSANILQGKNYLFIADSAAFGNIYGDQSDSSGNRFTLRNEKTFGTLLMNIKNYQGTRIIQLLTPEDKILSEKIMKADAKIEFRYVDQGNYRLRVIYDFNNDGKWTTGDFMTRRQPEPVSFYDQELYIKEGWSEENDWDISEQNVKKVKSKALKTR
jgi:hypothetical protein